jgi:hypothetical protein
MGALIAMKYPTKLFLKAADHTYVQCGSGRKAWGCWGGKSGGAAFNNGTGSTQRADAIAEPNERAGITCYLINGVCHQAANRILLPAGIIVSGARGYAVSSAMFGTYGKMGVNHLPCYAPFNQRVGVTGDLPECLAPGVRLGPREVIVSEAEKKYLSSVRQAYKRLDVRGGSLFDTIGLQIDLFERQVRFSLGEDIGAAAGKLRFVKESLELRHHQLIEVFRNKELSPTEFVVLFNALTLQFQDEIASSINKSQYKKLFALASDERVLLADPVAVKFAFGEKTATEVYGQL